MPKVTVVIPNHNHARFLAQRIESVLNQTYADFEVLYLDDASTDGSSGILAEFSRHGKIHLIHNDTNLGRGPSIDRAWDFVKTKYVAILDADDVALPSRFERQVSFMDANPRIGCSSGSGLVESLAALVWFEVTTDGIGGSLGSCLSCLGV